MADINQMPDFNRLKQQVDRLSVLLADPQPGLFTWCMMYGTAMEEISKFWNGDRPSKGRKPRSSERRSTA